MTISSIIQITIDKNNRFQGGRLSYLIFFIIIEYKVQLPAIEDSQSWISYIEC